MANPDSNLPTLAQRVLPPEDIRRNPADRRYLKIPERLRARYEELIVMPGYLELRHEIAILTQRLDDLMERGELGDSERGRRIARDAVKEIREELESGKIQRATEMLYDLEGELWKQVRSDEVWREIDRTMNTLLKLKDTEVRRMVAANQVLTVTESYNLVAHLSEFIEEYICEQMIQRLGVEEVRSRAVRHLHSMLERRNGTKANGEVTRAALPSPGG